MKQLRIRPRTTIYVGFLLATFMLLATLTQAQTRPGNPPDIGAVMTELQLTVEQQAAFVQIVETFRDTMETTMERHGVDPELGRPPLYKMRAIRMEMQANVAWMEQQMAALLTEEQMLRFRVLQAEQRENRRDRRLGSDR